MSRFMIKIFIIGLVCIFLISCSKSISPTVTTKDESVNKPKESIQVGMRLGLTEENSLSSNHFTYILEKGERFTPEIFIDSNFPEKMSYKLLFLINYKQKPVIYKGNLVREIIIDLDKYSSKEIKVNITNLKNGRNDLIVLLVRKPFKNLEKKQFVAPEQIYIARRASIIVGNEVKKTNRLSIVDSVNEEFPPNLQFVTTSNKPHSLSEAVTLANKQKLDEMWFHFHSGDSKEFAIVSLLNYKQVKILRHTFVKVNKKGWVHLPFVTSDLNLNSNPNDLILMIVENPYTVIEKENGKLKENLSWNIRFTNKITLN